MANGKTVGVGGAASDSETNQDPKSEAMDMADQEVTKLVSTPDIQCYEDMEGPDTSNGTSKASSPPPPPPSLHHTLNKRGRKKQLHPQQVLTPERMKEVVNTNLIQCGLCDIVIPSNDEAKHLQEWHRLTVPLDNTTCPLCCNPIHLLELVPHLTLVHNVTPPSTGHALLLWILTSNQLRKNNHHHLMNHPMSAMLLQQMLPSLKNSSPNATPPSSNATPPSHQPMPPTSSSFLQSLLNGGEPNSAAPGPRPFHPHHHPAPSPILNQHPSPPAPTNVSNSGSVTSNNSSVDINKLEHVVQKLTRKHMGLNARESYQCQVCSKWFAVPPIKHLRGHLVTFRDEQRPYINLINNNGYACLSCFHIAPSAIDITEHLSNFHHLDHPGGGQPSSPASSPIKPQELPADLPLNFTRPSRPSGIPTIIADPKGVELDNAGRVKSGKVRKQCELCGQWSNIKWFFKHMSEVHNALFCRCCREYLPIHEQEEHRKWHAEPPYMGQKIRIENGQPVIIDRKERASLTPIGSLAAWGGSSGGMVVKAIDDGTSQLISRKRKGANSGSTNGQASQAKISNTTSTKDTLMPKETCPVCGIQITYKNLARHIKLRHKIKYKFCHKCRKFVPNDTYEDHRLTCTAVASDVELNPGATPEIAPSSTSQNGSAGEEVLETHDSVDASDYLDIDGASALVINTDDNEDPNDLEEDGKRSNTSKNKLESLLGKEFKHPRRKCGICGYMVSYSNYKRHLKNAHPSSYSEMDGDDSEVRYLGHQMDEDDQDELGDEVDEDADIQPVQDSYAECTICGDHIMKEFLDRHMKMNHSDEIEVKNEVKMRECPVCEVTMRVEGIVKHCKLKHKVTYKWCRPCQKYVLKKQYRGHILSPSHREIIKDGEKHSSHEEEEDEDDLIESEDNLNHVETVLNETA